MKIAHTVYLVLLVCFIKTVSDYWSFDLFQYYQRPAKNLTPTPVYVKKTIFPFADLVSTMIIHRKGKFAFLVLGQQKISYFLNQQLPIEYNKTIAQWDPSDTRKIHYLNDCKLLQGGGDSVFWLSLGATDNEDRAISEISYSLYVTDKDDTGPEEKLNRHAILTYYCERSWVQ